MFILILAIYCNIFDRERFINGKDMVKGNFVNKLPQFI